MRAIALPVKSLSHAKSRLAPILSPLERGALALAMFEDALDAALALDAWETWVGLLRRERPGDRARPRRDGDPRGGATLHRAIAQIEAEASAKTLEALAILHADTPLITADALRATLHTLGPVVIAPSADARGTNLLLRRPPAAIPSRFGPDSYRRHLEVAAERALPIAVVERDELAFDLDAPGDILTVLETRRPGRTLEVCRDLDLPERLAARA